MTGASEQRSTTVSRAVELLHLLAEREDGWSITELARELGTQRPPLYRIVGSLMDRDLVHRDARGRYVLGGGILELARPLAHTLEELVSEPLQRAATEAGAGAVLVIESGDGLVAAATAVPEGADIHVATPVGHRFSAGPIAPRLAIESMRAPQADGDEVRDRGYATSAEQALAGAWAVAFPVALPERYGPACVMLVTLSADESDRLIAAGRRAVAEVELRSVRR